MASVVAANASLACHSSAPSAGGTSRVRPEGSEGPEEAFRAEADRQLCEVGLFHVGVAWVQLLVDEIVFLLPHGVVVVDGRAPGGARGSSRTRLAFASIVSRRSVR
jgi:hypothetical protein